MILHITIIIVIMRRALSNIMTILLSDMEVCVMTLYIKFCELRKKVEAGYVLSESEILEFANLVSKLSPEDIDVFVENVLENAKTAGEPL